MRIMDKETEDIFIKNLRKDLNDLLREEVNLRVELIKLGIKKRSIIILKKLGIAIDSEVNSKSNLNKDKN